MDNKGQSLLKLLFNEGESVCVSNNEFAFHSVPLEMALDGPLTLKSNTDNPDNICHSSDLILVSVNPINGPRRDSNVTSFRSFLVELDMGTIPEQLGTISHIKMPFSAQVFSGGKSVHTLITLDEDLEDEKKYRFIAEWIFGIIPQADSKCKNPSRMIRIPGAVRNNGKKQRLIGKIKNRVSQKKLLDWLNQYPHLEPKVRQKREFTEGAADFDRLSPWCRGILSKGIRFDSGRNQTWYSIFYDFALAGYSEPEAIDFLSKHFIEEFDFKEKEWLMTAQSAFNKVSKL